MEIAAAERLIAQVNATNRARVGLVRHPAARRWGHNSCQPTTLARGTWGDWTTAAPAMP